MTTKTTTKGGTMTAAASLICTIAAVWLIAAVELAHLLGA